MRFDGKQEKERISKSKSGHRERRFRKIGISPTAYSKRPCLKRRTCRRSTTHAVSRRLLHLLPEMKKRYAAKYPEMDMVSRVCRGGLLSEHSYDIIDWQMDVCLGAAVWLLDRIWEQENAAAVRSAAERG